MRWYLLHPISVHAPLALLPLGLAAAFLREFWGKPAWLDDRAVSWLLWLGAAGALAAMGLGLLAEQTAPHVPAAWDVLADHKTAGIWTAAAFSIIALWRVFTLGPNARRRMLLAAWFAATGVLLRAAYLGGRLVYDFGMGSAASQEQ